MKHCFSCWLLLAAAACLAGAESLAAQGDPMMALNEGNRHFRNGRLEEAVEAYRAGWQPASPHPTLAYNLGAALHHLGRLPEAVLWYRRAGDSDDPWRRQNLLLARRELGTRDLAPGGFPGVLAPYTGALRWTAVGLAWLGLGGAVQRRRLPFLGLVSILLLAIALYAAALAIECWGPRPAVLLGDCRADGATVPAGTEAWVNRRADGSFEIAGREIGCPAGAVVLIAPEVEAGSRPAPPPE